MLNAKPYHESASLSTLKAYNAVGCSEDTAVSLLYLFHHWLILCSIGLCIVNANLYVELATDF